MQDSWHGIWRWHAVFGIWGNTRMRKHMKTHHEVELSWVNHGRGRLIFRQELPLVLPTKCQKGDRTLHHYIKQPISVLGCTLFLCLDFDHSLLVQYIKSILSWDFMGFKRYLLYFWICLGNFCIFFSILVVGKPTTAWKKMNFECFPVDIIFLKPIKFQGLKVF